MQPQGLYRQIIFVIIIVVIIVIKYISQCAESIYAGKRNAISVRDTGRVFHHGSTGGYYRWTLITAQSSLEFDKWMNLQSVLNESV